MLQISRRREFLIPQPYQGVVVKRHSVGEAFVADAAGPDALQKLARYERTLMNNQQTALRELKELQDGRVEQAANSV